MKLIVHIFPFCEQFIENLSVGESKYYGEVRWHRDGYGSAAFERLRLLKAADFVSSLHRQDSRKK